jgi:deoxycytidylate deaminase
MEELIKATGKVKIVIHDENGVVKEERNIDNLVVTVGKSYITSRMIGTSSGVMSHMEVGTDNTSASAAQTALIAAVAASRTSLTSSTQTTASSNDDSVQYVCTFPAGTGTGALVEAGIFNASSSGTMLCRTVFAVVNKGASDAMTITWTVTLS